MLMNFIANSDGIARQNRAILWSYVDKMTN